MGRGLRNEVTRGTALACQLALVAPGVVLLALFFALPVLAVTVDAFREGVQAFVRVFATPGFWRALAGSTTLTLVAATLSTVVGIAVALHLSRLSQRRRTALSFVIALPLTFSGLIVAYGFILGYGRAGFVTQLLATSASMRRRSAARCSRRWGSRSRRRTT